MPLDTYISIMVWRLCK